MKCRVRNSTAAFRLRRTIASAFDSRAVPKWAAGLPRADHPNRMKRLSSSGFFRHGSGVRWLLASQCLKRQRQEKSPGDVWSPGPKRHRRALDLVIPHRVAPQQSPTPFHQASHHSSARPSADNRFKTGQTRPRLFVLRLGTDALQRGSPKGYKPLAAIDRQKRQKWNRTTVHRPILKRPSLA